MSHHETFFTEKKGRSVRLSPTTKFGRAVWVVEGAGGAYQPKIWPYSHPALRRPKAPLFATSAKRSPNALRARGQMERKWGTQPSNPPRMAWPTEVSATFNVPDQEDRRGVSTHTHTTDILIGKCTFGWILEPPGSHRVLRGEGVYPGVAGNPP